MNREDLPLFLRVSEMARVMQIGKNQAYDLAHRPDFPAVRVGHRIVVQRDQLFAWFDRHANEQTPGS